MELEGHYIELLRELWARVDASGRLLIVDWDTLVKALRERDLMFIGGGVWNRRQEVEWFYEGYGRTELNLTALVYYRHERIVQDIAEICDEVFSPSGGAVDRAELPEQFSSQFELGNVVEIARATDRALRAGGEWGTVG